MKTPWIRRLVAVVCLPISLFSQVPPVPRIPVEDFFVESDYRMMRVSPDGKQLAFLTTLGTGKVGIAMMDLATGKTDALVAATDENIKTYFWKGNDYIVYGGDLGGDESYAWRSITVKPDKRGKRRVVALADAYNEDRMAAANLLYIEDELKFDPYRILAYGRRNSGNGVTSYYLVDVRDGKRTPAWSDGAARRDTTSQVVDNDGIIRARMRYEGKSIICEVRPRPTDLYVKVAEFPADDPRWSFWVIGADNETLYFVNREKHDVGTLHTLHLPTLKISEPLFTPPEGEIESLLMSYDRRRLYGVQYSSDRDYYHFFDPARARLQAQIDAALPGTENDVVSMSGDEKIHVIAARSDRDPGTYYILDLNRGSIGAVGKVNSRINPAAMQPMRPIKYQARDGLTIHGYLTLPAGAEGRKVPLIVNPHGGPFGIRDYWGFNGEVQFLANRGYAVLQINYRGSGGYGTSFLYAGRKEWGGKMQDDLSDGVKWVIEQGIADPDRVAIYGGSYGGYAALAGVAFTPELYRCAVNYVGVSDLSILQRMTVWGQRSLEDYAEKWIGRDRQYVYERSPLNFVERIRVPTLHAYGFNDPRVDIEHWKRLEPKLKQFNKPYEIMIMGNEGHGFANENNRIAFYKRMEDFFARHLAPPASMADTTAKPKS